MNDWIIVNILALRIFGYLTLRNLTISETYDGIYLLKSSVTSNGCLA